jgi:superfamily II DNA or RNA helicase
VKLRPYQVSAIQSLRRELIAGRNRIVLYAPTGAGKSVIIESLVRSATEKGKRVAIIANRLHLIKQLVSQFAAGNIAHGVIQGQNTMQSHLPVIICSIQTVARRGLPHVDLILIDECHATAGGKEYRKLIEHNSAIPIVGLTATPFAKGMAKKYSFLGQEPLWQSLVVAATIKDLIKDGYLVDCDIFAPTEPDLTGVKTQKNKFGEIDYEDKSVGEAMDKAGLVGDIVQHWLKMSRGKPTICFASSISHSMNIVAQFQSVGVAARHIDCYMAQEVRDEILADFKAGRFTVLSNVALIAEGFDYPAASVMILARPTRSLIRYIQMAGRVLRICEGKTKALILDHSGSVHTLGYPTDDLPLMLDDGTTKAAGEKKQEKKDRKCPSCSYIKTKGGKCPQCGFEPVRAAAEVEVVEGELALVKRIEAKKADKLDKQQMWSELLSIQLDRGYSSGWTANQYRKLFGVWPRGMMDCPLPPSKATKDWLLGQRIRWVKAQEAQRAA